MPATVTYRGAGIEPTDAASETATASVPPAHSTRFASESVAIAHSARSGAPLAPPTA